MDNFNHNIIEQLEAEVKNKHYHEELVLQGRMVGIRNGHSLNIQGPHDILMAEMQVVTPAGIHTLVLQDGNRHTGTFREWDREYTKPNSYQKRLLEMWKQERSWEKAESDKWCMRGHRTTEEAKTCNGTVKPVFELSDPPRVVPRSSGTKKASYRLRPRGETYWSYNMRKNNQKYVPFLPSQNQGVWARCTTSKQQTLTPGLQCKCTPSLRLVLYIMREAVLSTGLVNPPSRW